MGLDMLAQRAFLPGEVVLTESPTLVIPATMPPPASLYASSSAAGEDVYESLFGLLSPGAKQELSELAWGRLEKDDGRAVAVADRSTYETLMRINSLAVSLPLSSSAPDAVSPIYRGIFLKTNRINHKCVAPFFHFFFQLSLSLSCSPNTEWTTRPLCPSRSSASARSMQRATRSQSRVRPSECLLCTAPPRRGAEWV